MTVFINTAITYASRLSGKLLYFKAGVIDHHAANTCVYADIFVLQILQSARTVWHRAIRMQTASKLWDHICVNARRDTAGTELPAQVTQYVR